MVLVRATWARRSWAEPRPWTRQPPPSGIFPSFLMSTWTRSPGVACTSRWALGRAHLIRVPVAGSVHFNRGQWYRWRTLWTVEGLSPR
jgi:hypothetical protein